MSLMDQAACYGEAGWFLHDDWRCFFILVFLRSPSLDTRAPRRTTSHRTVPAQPAPNQYDEINPHRIVLCCTVSHHITTSPHHHITNMTISPPGAVLCELLFSFASACAL
jgi:hypothetical protein